MANVHREDAPGGQPGPENDETIELGATARMSRGADGTGNPTPTTPASAAAPVAAPVAAPFLFSPLERIAGRYRIEACIARGGMGEVYRAVDLDLDVPVALKTIRPEIAGDPASLRQFKQEVLMARSVSHPNVCRIFDLGHHVDESRDAFFLTMEYLPGETLASRIRARGPLSGPESLALLRPMADALDAAHRAGVVHRDLKSVNVMLVPENGVERPVLTDFGLASRTRGGSEPKGDDDAPLVGTPAYMAPEQVAGEPTGPAADLYSLGVVLFEMRTARVPFDEPTPAATATARLRREPPPPSSLAPIEPTWERAILRLLARDPGERFAHARDAVDAVEGRPSRSTSRGHALSAERDRFVGREREIAELARALERGPSLVLLLGPAGAGKSRLARHYGWEALERWPGGVWCADLADARTQDAVASAVADSLGVSLGGSDPVGALGLAIAERGRALVILDNVEQVASHADTAVRRWMAQAEGASFLLTSRERVPLEGGRVIELDPLPEGTDGVALFLERARTHRPDLSHDPATRARVEEIVRAVDGLPLAIELAAARLRTLSLEQLRARIGDRLDLLAGPVRGRRATLRATLDESWELLHPWERAAVAQCSVFDGGFTLEAAEAVLDLNAHPRAPLPIDVVQALLDKSWLRTQIVGGAPRFRMLASLQEYASEKLAAENDGASLVSSETRHGEYFAALGDPTRRGGARTERVERAEGAQRATDDVRVLFPDLGNLIVACRRAVARGRGEQASTTLAAAWQVLRLRGPVSVGLELAEQVAALPDLPLRMRAITLRCLVHGLVLMGRTADARRSLEEELTVQRALGDRGAQAVVLANLGVVCKQGAQPEAALRHDQEALEILRELGDRRLEGQVRSNLALVEFELGRTADARRSFLEALAIHREVGNRLAEGTVLGNYGYLLLDEGELDEALARCTDGLAIHREMGNRREEGHVLANLGSILSARGEPAAAREHLERAIEILREVGDRPIEGQALVSLAAVLLDDEATRADAAAHIDQALTILREVGDRHAVGQALGFRGALHRLNRDFTAARAAFDEGAQLLGEVGDSRELGRLLCARALCERDAGDLTAARGFLSHASQLAARVESRTDSPLAREVEACRIALRG